MFSRFTANSRRVMQRAFREAKRWQHDFVGTEHLLFGLLCDSDGPACSLLRAIDVNPELLLRKTELSLERHDGGMAMEHFPLSPASKRVFRAAGEEAALVNHQMIGPEHLLLGLLRESECEAAQLLSATGVKLPAVRDSVARLSPDAYADAHVQEQPRFAQGDNPSADELERWIAPPPKHDDSATPPVTQPGWASLDAPPGLNDVVARLRATQLVLGGVMGFAFGYWLNDWLGGLLGAFGGVIAAGFRSSWLGVFVGVVCGLFVAPAWRGDDIGLIGPPLLALAGALLGSFLGDGWDRAKRQDEPKPDV